MPWLLDRLWGPRIERETTRHLKKLTEAASAASKDSATRLLGCLAESDDTLLLGHTHWGAPVRVPLEHIVKSFSLVTGGTGSGKTRFALGLIASIIERLPERGDLGLGVLDAKGDLYHGTLYLLGQLLSRLSETDPQAARDLRRRIVIIDFGSSDPLSAYNVLVRWPDAEPDFFASSRAEMLLDLLAGADRLSLGGAAVLQKLLLLLSEQSLPVTYIDDVLTDRDLLGRLVAASKDENLQGYFARQFGEVPKATISALRRRVEALFSSGSVRLALAGESAPDFRRLMDESRIVLVNCFGPNISRTVRRVLQGLVVSDVRQAVFARRKPQNPFLWACDEAANFFLTEKLRDNMTDMLTMARSFGTFMSYLTQNMSTAVQDARMLKVLYTNIRWSFSMRGEPSDGAFLKSVLPTTGRKLRPQFDPYAAPSFCSPSEERGLLLEEIANLPDRTGYLWLRTEGGEAISMRTADVAVPPARDLETVIASLKKDATVGGRLSRKVYERQIADRDRKWKNQAFAANAHGPELKLTEAYRRIRGKERQGDVA